jgi:serine/threonine-protein kinase HipA
MMHRKAADGAIDYEDFMRLSRRLAGAHEAAECFRRAVFNLLTTNRDDHGRNHSFLYDENTMTWSLAPAYDLNTSVFTTLIALHWLGSAQVPIRFTSLLRLAEIGGISAKAAREIYGQVEAATLGGWRTAATKAEVPPAMIEYWQKEMTRQTQPLRDDATVSAASAGRRKTKREAFE